MHVASPSYGATTIFMMFERKSFSFKARVVYYKSRLHYTIPKLKKRAMPQLATLAELAISLQSLHCTFSIACFFFKQRQALKK